MMKKTAFFNILLLLISVCLRAQTDTQNYVYAKNCLDADCIKKTELVQYFDGLGRPFQTIGIKGTPLKKDIVAHIEYDQYGRTSKSYLPVPQLGTQNGLIYDNPLNNASTNYGTEKIYAEQIVENSPLERVKQNFGTGTDWNNKPVNYNYNTNTTTNEVKKYSVTTSWVENRTESPLAGAGNFYPVNSLMKTSVTDEDGNTATEYKNGKGQTILIRKNDGSKDINIYYVYNAFNQLVYVIPPLASAIGNLSTTDINNLCYQYRYDGSGRLVEKKIPGKSWEYMVYDKQDRIVLNQDAILATVNNSFNKKGWLFTKYDASGRVVYSGFFANTANRITMQNALDNMSANPGNNESRSTTPFTLNGMDVYYTKNAFPTGSMTILSVNYYDTYPVLPSGVALPAQILGHDVLQDSQNAAINTLSLPVASYVKNMDDDNWTKDFIWYDLKGRTIGSHSINYLGGYTKTESEIDFAGVIQKSNIYHVRKQGEVGVTIKERYVYDDQNRLLQHYHQVDDKTEELLTENSYNELSQLINKKVGNNLQSIDYAYNIRGWLTDINKDQMAVADLGGKLFSYKIKYNQKNGITNPDNIQFPNKNVTAKYNGNITEVDWRAIETMGVNPSATPKRYGYAYDSLNRLTAGYYQNPNNPTSKENTESLDYDVNGNIKNLYRTSVMEYGNTTPTLVDNLEYIYAAGENKLTNINDYSYNPTGYQGGGNEIQYDLNGNMMNMMDKGIDYIKYNYLNLPKSLHLNRNGIEDITINTKYSADGTKLRKENTTVISGLNGFTTQKTNVDYLDGFQYSAIETPGTGGGGDPEMFSARAMQPTAFSIDEPASLLVTKTPDLQFFGTAEGFYDYTKDQYIYQYADQIGNARVSFARNSAGALTIVDSNDYYPFGMNHLKTGNSYFGQGSYKNYKFNGVELQETGLYAMDWRNYMSDVGRFAGLDALAESYQDLTPNHFAANNPISFSDPSGMYIREYDGSITYKNSDEIKVLQTDFDGRVDDLARYMSERSVFKHDIPEVAIPVFKGSGNNFFWGLQAQNHFNSFMKGWNAKSDFAWDRWNNAGRLADGPVKMIGGHGDILGLYDIGGQVISTWKPENQHLAMAVGLFAAVALKKTGLALAETKVEGNLALGLSEDLFTFAKTKKFDTYKTFSTGFQEEKILDAMHTYDNLHFNVTGFSKYQFSKFDPLKPLSHRNYTNWEMHTIFNNPQLLNKTTFYRKAGNSYEALSNFSPFAY